EGRTITRRSLGYLGVSCLAGSSAADAAAPGAEPGSGVILRNCLFMDLIRNTKATARAAKTRNPRIPGVTMLLAGAAAASSLPGPPAAATTSNVKGTPSPGRPRT